MRAVIAAFAMLFAPFAVSSALGEDEDPRLSAVLVYADWCGACQVLDPRVEAVKDADTLEGVAFVTLDYTARDREGVLAAADAAGIGPAMREHLARRVKTGQLVLVDMDDQTVVDTLGRRADEADILEAIQSAAAEA